MATDFAAPANQALRAFVPAKIDIRASGDQEDGSVRSILELIEHNARHNPSHLFCVQARKRAEESERTGLDLLSISHLQLKAAVMRCASWLVANLKELERPHVGDNGEIVRGPAIALFMESDIDILFYLFALMSLGVPVSRQRARSYSLYS